MGYIDLHGKPFDAATIVKLEIFEDYAEAWIPTFVMSGFKEVCIFDFFAGTGYDKNNVPGSPIRLLEKIKKYIHFIAEKGTKLTVYFNEYVMKKFKMLMAACDEFLSHNPELAKLITIEYSNEDFEQCFNRLYPVIQKFPSLVYLDQNGIKYLADKFLLALEKTDKTDFLYFVSSSYFLRFGQSEEFQNHVSFDLEAAKKDPYKYIHRNLIGQLRGNLPANTKLKLYPYTLKKGTNIYGIIFGAKSPRAVDKFLDIAWKRNPINGDANFDIDSDLRNQQTVLFGDRQITKKEVFYNSLEQKLKAEKEVTNGDIFLFTLECGHPKQHAAEYLKHLKKTKCVDYPGVSPKIHYDGLTKVEEHVNIKWIKK